MTQAMIKGSVTRAIIRISREKKKQTLTYITKKVQTWVNAKIIKKRNKNYGHTGHKGKDKKKGYTGYY